MVSRESKRKQSYQFLDHFEFHQKVKLLGVESEEGNVSNEHL